MALGRPDNERRFKSVQEWARTLGYSVIRDGNDYVIYTSNRQDEFGQNMYVSTGYTLNGTVNRIRADIRGK